jgi:hypothetical protein
MNHLRVARKGVFMDGIRPIPLVLRKPFVRLLLLAGLAAALFVFRPLALPVGLLLAPLCAYLYGLGAYSLAFLMPTVPVAAYRFGAGGGDPYLSVLLFVLPYLCMAALMLSRRLRFSLTGEAGLCVAVYLAVLLGMLARVSAMLGAPLFAGLSAYAVAQLNSAYQAGDLYFRLASAGFLTVPEGMRAAAGLQLGGMVWLNPLLQLELSNMLRLRLDEGLRVWVPTLLMQGSLTLGLFCALLAERGAARKAGTPAAAPLFRTLHLPKREQGYLLFICVATVLTSVSGHTYTALLCTALYATFAGVCQLLGAAVLVFLFSRRHPARAPLYGALATALYILFPLALFVLGIADQLMHLRARGLSQQEEE